MTAWGLGTGTIWIARDYLSVPWPVALLVGGLIIGIAESLIERDAATKEMHDDD
jgi:hypothetical protein